MIKRRLLALALVMVMVMTAAAFVYADEGTDEGGAPAATEEVVKADQVIKVTTEKEVVVGKTVKLDAKLVKGDGAVTFVSSDAKVAEVSAKGVVKAKGIGTATIKVAAAVTEKFAAAEVEVTVTVIPKSITPTSLVCKKGGKLTVKWSKLKGVDGYELEYCKSKKFDKAPKTKKVKKAKTKTVTIKKLKKKTKYYVRMRTYKEVAGVKYYSKWSKPKMIKAK